MDSSHLTSRRAAVVRSWDLREGAVLVPSGLPVPIAGSDQSHAFHAHPEFTYLAGVQTAGAALGFDAAEGWTLFAPVAGQEDRVWVGDGESLDEIAASSAVDRVRPLNELDAWLESRRAEPLALLGNADLVAHPRAYGIQGWRSLELELAEDLAERLSDQVSEARRAKDPAEVGLMRAAADRYCASA